MGPRILQYSDVENAYDEPDRIGRLAGLIGQLRDERTIVVGTGDDTAPGVLSLVTGGRQALDFFDRIEPDLETFGNHDFDHGYAATRDVVRRSPQTWVSANVFHEGERFGNAAGVVPTAVVERAGVRVGFFGVLDPATPSINPKASDLVLEDPIEVAERAVTALHSEGVDHVVALSHLGAGDDTLARAVDVDAVLGGHVHAERLDRVDGTLCTRPGANGTALIEVDLGEEVRGTRHRTETGPRDEAVAATLRERMRRAGLDEVVGVVDEPIERTEEVTVSGECRIGNWVADAYRWAADTDVALHNAGGIRSGPPLAGEVTLADCIGVVPFDGPLTVGSVTGAELKTLLSQAIDADVGFGEPDWWHAHVSGLRVALDGSRVESVRVDGAPVDPDAEYSIAASRYLFETDHEFPALTTAHRRGTIDVQYEVLAEYARRVGIGPTLDGRLQRSKGKT
ncbi:bifunctional metallophosphatase/5'-nucleotidase [Halalkalicoccus subterraneus]|uniref:bifunctional metallophosphatase/5'-nucleotidase n=1 Tax=Halalkalicoccus subterraneus TaxID=2675002 RepID=UPI000EFB9900|nr:5'-nucleotidase C-terminal domain-containing protein [Halalkalicoccus subterraneus]